MTLRKTLIKASIATALTTLAGTAIASSSSHGGGGETSVGGYGELHYNNLSSDTEKQKEIDFHRFVLFFDHEFNDKIRFVSELELEHTVSKDTADGSSGGAVQLEQAYIEMDLDDSSTFRAGILLIPAGLINETHEPNTFYGVERNPVEKNIIPTTWWEAGGMYSAHMSNGISYNLAIHSGLNNADGKIRSGRQKAAQATAESLAYTARIKYTGIPGLELAGTAQIQEDMSQGVAAKAVGATLIEAHAKYSSGPLAVTALYANWDVDINTTAKTQTGSIVEASYKLNSKLGVFTRQNNWTNDNGVKDKAQTDIGINYWPHENVVFKADYQMQNDDAGDMDGFNLGVGYQF